MVYRRMKLLIRINPLPIEIDQTQITSIISNDNTIDVKHWHNLENEVLSKYFGDMRIAQ